VLVIVVSVRGVTVPVMDVVDVAGVLDGKVTAGLAVLVGVGLRQLVEVGLDGVLDLDDRPPTPL
jgi:hypothetical protein